MIRTLSLALAVLLWTFASVSQAGTQSRDILNPTQVSPQLLGSTTLPIDIAWPVVCPCTLTVTNGSPSSNFLSPTRVLAGWVYVDGTLVLTPVQISPLQGTASAVLSLSPGPHQIQVYLNGLPGSYVTLRLTGSVSASNLATARAGHSATLRPDGQVLVAGGEGSSGVLSSTEVVASDGSATTAGAPMTLARAGHAAALTAGSSILFSGGRDASSDLSAVEVLTPVGAVSGLPLDEVRRAHTATTLTDGRVLILGGRGTGGGALSSGLILDPRPDAMTDDRYDPTAAGVTNLGNILQVARFGHTATLLPDGRVLVIGGRNGSTDLVSMELVDPATATSVPLPLSLTSSRSNHTATLRSNGSILVAGGRTGTSILGSIEIVRPALNAVDPGGSLVRARANHSATMIRGGEILIAGGRTATGITAHTEFGPPPPADSAAPSIVAIAPANGAADIDRGIVVGLHTSEPLDPTTVSASQIALRNQNGVLIPAAIGIADQGTLMTIRPDTLLPGDVYTVTLNGVTDRAGLPLAPASFSFTVVATPVISAIAPVVGPAGTEVTVTGAGFDVNAAGNHLSFAATMVPVVPVSATSLTFVVPSMTAGSYPISLRTRGGQTTAPVPFELAQPIPALSAIAPGQVTAGSPTFTMTLTGANFVDGATVVIGTTNLPAVFISATSLQVEVPAASIVNPGTFDVRVVNPGPAGGTSNALPLTVTSSGPVLSSLVIFPRGMSLSIGGTQTFTVQARYSDGSSANVSSTATWVSSDPQVLSVSPAGASSAVAAGTATVTASFGGQSAMATVRVYADEAIPPDPADVAPDLNPTESTPTAEATRFLYEGANPIQRGVVPGAIEVRRASVIRGAVRTRDGQPVSGVRITVKDADEIGYTLTRLDGAFDMAVNGGGSLVVQFTKAGLLPIERRVVVPGGDFYPVPDVVMIALDPAVTNVDLTAATAMQVARGSVVTDSSGSRRATILFPQGTTAQLRLANGTTEPLTSMSVRATEYTVGATGPEAMPGSLPPASAYTHAVELSVDEALAVGATSVEFAAPIPVYYENFLGFPIGAGVPVGYYDRARSAWVPSENGVVLKILSVDGAGRVELDLNGDTVPDDAAALAVLGITDAERTTLASTYTVGQGLWRVAVRHFTPFDHNWPVRRPSESEPNSPVPPPQEHVESKKRCEVPGSIVECQDQVLGERLEVTGTPFTINYRSDRVPGFKAADSVTIPLVGATVPPSVSRIGLTVVIAGQVFSQSFVPAPGLTVDFTWNRQDAYGRLVHGTRKAYIRIEHLYETYYAARAFATEPREFGQFNVTIVPPTMLLVPSRQLEPVSMYWYVELGAPPPASASVGGWSLAPHHVYSPASHTLFYGDGTKRIADPQVAAAPIESLALPEYEYLNAVVAKSGIYYITYENGRKVFRQTGTDAPVIVGSVEDDYTLVVDEDGVVYYAHCAVDVPGGISISRFVAGEAELVASAILPGGGACDNFMSMARAPDGTMYLSHSEFLFQMSPGGPLEFVRQFDTYAEGIAVGADGTLYRSVFSDTEDGQTIERITPSGSVVRVAGNGSEGSAGDGGRAIDAELGYIYDFAVAPDGSLLLTDFGDEFIRLRRVGPDGIIRTIAGGAIDNAELLPDGTPATAIGYFEHVDVGSDGLIYVFGHQSYRFALSPDVDRPTSIASENGTEIYEFTPAGRHLRTINALTGATRYIFGYDAGGRLTTVTDGDGLITQVQRGPDGKPTSIVAPFGQTTALSVTTKGWLSSITAPGSRTTTLISSDVGLLTELRDRRNQVHEFGYDSKGLLIRDDDPAGGSQTLGRIPTGASNWVSTRTTEMGRVTSYATERLQANGAQQLTITAPDGTTSVTTSHEDGSRETIASTGTRSVVSVLPDPRFGLQVPIPASTIVTTPGGLTLETQVERSVEFEDPLDFSTLNQEDSITVNGRTYQTSFEGATRTFTTTTPEGRTTTSTIDAQGRVTQTQMGSLTPVNFGYDPQGRLATITQGTRQSSVTYDLSGRPSDLTDALMRSVTFGYDEADRVTTHTLPDTRTIGFSYDANSNVTSLTPPGRPAHSFGYTPIDFTSAYTPPTVAGTGPTGYLFNADRQPTALQRPDGQTTTFTYGTTTGRLTGVTFSRGTLVYGYDTAGRVSSLADPGGVNLAFTYDGALPLTETWSGPIDGSVSRTFTNNFEVATEQVNGTSAVSFGYDDDRLLTSAGALTIARHPSHGLVTGTTLDTTTETFDYNEFGEPTAHTAHVGGTTVFDVQTSRDALGRIRERIETIDGITRVFTYGYDLAGRLWQVHRNGTLVVRYTYDSNGNRLSAAGEAGLAEGTYDDQDRVLTYDGATYTYTANGELTSKTIAGQTTSYVYDTLGNLIQVTLPNGTVITYAVDGRGRRVGKSIDGVFVKGWLYGDQLRPIAELDGSGAVVSRFVYGSRANVPEYLIKDGTTYRIFSDHLGSPRIIVDAATGAVVHRMDFGPFGDVQQNTNPGWQPFGFAGGLYDSDTGLVRFGARDYDAHTGRWTAKDPIGFEGGDSNFHAYVASDPVNLVDPKGLDAIDTALKAVSDFSAGFGDTLTSGLGFFDTSLTEMVRQALPGDVNGVVDRCSISYQAGEYSAWVTVIAGAAGAVLQIEINVMSNGNVFKILSKTLKRGYRIDPAHHNKPWGHSHFWKW